MMGLYIDAMNTPEFRDCQICDFYYAPNDPMRATIRNRITGKVDLYELDLVSRRPVPVCQCGYRVAAE